MRKQIYRKTPKQVKRFINKWGSKAERAIRTPSKKPSRIKQGAKNWGKAIGNVGFFLATGRNYGRKRR